MADENIIPQEGTPAPAEGQQAQPEMNLDPVVNRMEELFNTRFDDLAQRIAPPAEQQQEEDPLAALFGPQDPQQQQEIDPYGQQQGVDPQQFQQAIQQAIQQQVQQAVAPLHAEREATRLADLEQKYPKLQDEQYATELVGQAMQFAQARGISPDADMLEMVHLARVARDAAAQEVPAQGQPGVQLETAGAAPQDQPAGNTLDQLRAAQGYS